MKNIVRLTCVAGITVITMIDAALAQLMAGPAASWDKYDLIARVTIRAIDPQREVQYLDSPEAKAFGYPVEVEMVEPLRMPPGTHELQLLLPAYFVINGRKMPALQMSNGEVTVSNTLAITCQSHDHPDYLVIADVLSEETWAVYRQQKEGGVESDGTTSEIQVVPDLKNRFDAIQQKMTLGDQLRSGEITEEEYALQKAALDEMIFSPAVVSNYNPALTTTSLQVDPAARERIDASQKRMFLQYQLQSGEITEEEYLLQKKPLDEILSRPVEIDISVP